MRELLKFTFVILVLLLALVNIENFLKPKFVKVLGAETTAPSNQEFWNDFLSKNPDYIPGWEDTGRTDKVRQIDPNYLQP